MYRQDLDLLIDPILAELSLPNLHLRAANDQLAVFCDSLAEAKESNPYGAYVSHHAEEELVRDGGCAFLSYDNLCGVFIFKDGNIGAVFKSGRSTHRAAHLHLLLTALVVGGNKLDCFDGVLSLIYSGVGFIPVARVRFDREYAPVNWNFERDGEPDVVFWIHNGDTIDQIAKKYRTYPTTQIDVLPLYSKYEEAYAYRDSLITKP